MSLLSLRAKLIGGAAALLILAAIGYCHARDAEHVQQGVRQERVRVADSVIRVTDTLMVTQTKVLTKALSRADSQRIATRFEFANTMKSKPADTQLASAGSDTAQRDHRITPPAASPVLGDTMIPHLVRVCNAQIASDSLALVAALSALHTCGVEKDAWKAKALIVQPQPSRVKPFVAGVVTALGAIGVGAIIVHHRK